MTQVRTPVKWPGRFLPMSDHFQTPVPRAEKLQALLVQLQLDYGYSRQDAFLVLKDILAQIWNTQK